MYIRVIKTIMYGTAIPDSAGPEPAIQKNIGMFPVTRCTTI